MGKDKNKPRGFMTPYACFVKVIRAEHRKKHPDETIVFSDFSKKCGQKWAQMNDKEKVRFIEMSKKDKLRYSSEMADYVPPEGQIAGDKRGKMRTKRKKDPNAPKRALSGFMWFCMHERPNIKKESPHLKMGDIAKVLSEKWKNCIDKGQFETQAATDKKRYMQEMERYRASKGGAGPMMLVQSHETLHLPKKESDSESEESGSDDDDESDE